MISAAGVEPGMKVLDVACGAGSQTLRAARRVGTSGQVLASDIAPTMLEYVRATAADAGLDNVRTAEGAAEELRLSPASFDAAICRLGLMLFVLPADAVSAVQAALPPGARFAALVFTTAANNPFMSMPMAILLQHSGDAPPAPGTPGLFALGGEGVLDGLLSESGLTDVTTRRCARRTGCRAPMTRCTCSRRPLARTGPWWHIWVRPSAPPRGPTCETASCSSRRTMGSRPSWSSSSAPGLAPPDVHRLIQLRQQGSSFPPFAGTT